MGLLDDLIGGVLDKGLELGLDYAKGSKNRTGKRQTVSESFTSRRLVYGESLVAGTMTFAESGGTTYPKHDYLFLVYVLASQHSDFVSEIRFDDVPMLIGLENAYDHFNSFKPREGASSAEQFLLGKSRIDARPELCFQRASLGKPGFRRRSGAYQYRPNGVWTILGNEVNGGIDYANSKNVGDYYGMTAVSLALQYSATLYPSGIPRLTFVMRGKVVYDPRTDSMLYSTNYALCVYDFLLNILKIPAANINTQTIIDAANICDQDVPTVGGATEKRFTVNGVLELDKTPLENLEILLRAGGGWLPYVQGKWSLFLPVYTAPILDLDDSDLVSQIRFRAKSGKRDRINVAKSSYISKDHDWERVEAPVISIQSYIDNDGERLEGTFDYELVTSGYQAQRLSRIKLEQSRYGISLTARFKFKALKVTVGDRVTLTISKFGWSSKVFQVTSCEIDYERGVTLGLREDAASIYAWEAGDALPLQAPEALNLPDHREIDAPSSMSVSEELYQTNNTREVKARAIIEWVPDDSGIYKYNLEIKPSSESEWTPVVFRYPGSKAIVNDIAPDTYDVRVQSVNDVGFTSDWFQISATVLGKTAPPPDVSGLVIDRHILSWSYPNAPLDLAGFEIRVRYDGGVAWDDAAPFHAGIITASSYDVSGVIGITTFLVKAVDTTGNYSAGAVALPIELGDMVNITLSYSGNNAILTWPENTSAIKSVITVLEYNGAIIQETYDNRFIVPVSWIGSRSFIVRASLLPGYWGADTQVIISPNAPGVPVVTARVIANSVTLHYTSVKGSLPIDRYEIRRGGTYNAAQEPEIKAGTSSFTISDETSAGTITFWFEAVDVAGNRSGHVSVSAIVSQPQNYQLLDQYSAKANAWPGNMTNCMVTEDDHLILPINTTETWAQHFTNNAFNSPQDQINAGFEYYLQPSTNTAQYVLNYDYLSIIDTATLTANSAPIILDGSVTVAVHIEYSLDNINWTSGGAGQTQVIATNFRYVRVTLDFAAVGGDDLAYVEDILISIEKKVDDDSGKFSAVATDTNGTRVYFNKDFIDAQTPTVNVSSTEIVDVVVDFNDIPDPEYFDVYVFSRATGNRINASGSWIVRGFTRIGA